tara:strand:+ start:30498 stop:30791 length:294 start_codon:yes stop_codon:yes gene_type:complete
MGDIADYYRDDRMEFEQEFIETQTESGVEEFKWWELGNGNRKKAVDMDESHLRNCITKIKRESWRTEWLPTLEDLLAKRESRWKTLAKTKMPFKRRI